MIQIRQETTNSPGDLVAQLLAGDDGDLLTHPLVGVKVAAQPGVIFFNDDPSGLLYRLGPDSPLETALYNHLRNIIKAKTLQTSHASV